MVRAMFRDDVHGWVPARGPCDPRAQGSGGHFPARDGRRVQAGTLTRRAAAARAAVGSAASLWRLDSASILNRRAGLRDFGHGLVKQVTTPPGLARAVLSD